jgi:predicted transposase/invertase (TIGR01784 family)
VETDYESPMIRRLTAIAETLSDEEKTRILAQKREESLMNERYELAAARKKGRGEREKEIAASMLDQGIPVEMIAKCTGLSSAEVKKLKKKPFS